MARLSYVEKEGAGPEQEKILAQVMQKSVKIANIWKLWAHSPLTLETFMAFYKTLMMKGPLDAKLRGPYGCFRTRTAEKTTELYQLLRKENVVVSLREGNIRVSPHLYNSERDIDRLISVVTA